MSKIDTEGAFAPADDVFAALESIPGIDDDFAERAAARESRWNASTGSVAALLMEGGRREC